MASTEYEIKASQVYADIMGEVKIRLRTINEVGNGDKLKDLPSPIVREFCYLQTRKGAVSVGIGKPLRTQS